MKLKLLHKILILLLISFPEISIKAQGERDNWYFGLLAGMKFNGVNAQSVSDNAIERQIVLGMIEGPDNIICANDEDGNLMFYSDGRIFKNRLHQNLLNSPTNEFAVRYTHAAIARDPGNPNLYYVFVTIADGLKSRLSYTVVDMSLDNGLGGVVPNKRHIIMANDVGEHMVVARHANGRDSWLICVRKGVYNAFLINENGIATSPVLSTAGVSLFDGNLANFGALEISPDNEYLAAAFPGLLKVFLLSFNDFNGRVSLIYEYEDLNDSVTEQPNGTVEFSENSKVLYHSGSLSGIKQFNISNTNNIPNPIEIASGGIFPQLRRGPDGKIYSGQSGRTFIGAIQEPNLIGAACDYDDNVLSLSGSQLLDLPVFLQPKFPEGISFINICEGETTEFNFISSFRDVSAFQWDFGDGNTNEGESVSHTYSNPGIYTVTVNVFDDTNTLIFTDVKDIEIFATPTVNEPADIYLCTDDTTFFINLNNEILSGLDSSLFNVTYYFSELDALLLSNEVFEYIPEIGIKTVWVRIQNRVNPSCFDLVNFDIVTPQFITIDIPTEQFICDTRAGLTLNAPDGFISYQWSNGANTQSTTVDLPGNYTLTVEQDFGAFTCQAQTTVSVLTGDELPIIEEIKVLDWSQNHNSIEIILDRNGIYEFSVDGINYQESPIFLNLPIDDYKVYVRDARCLQELVSDELFLLYFNRFFTPNGDGVNDYWQVINSTKEENIKITIFDRYGKRLASLRYFDLGWDGTFNGMDMPSSDYWFQVEREDGRTHYGHFTLKR